MSDSLMKLGRTPSRRDPRTLKLGRYLRVGDLPPAPESVDWTGKASRWGMMANDRYGNCVFAGSAHHVQCWTSTKGTEVIVPDDQVVAAYLDYTGGADRGANILDVLNIWRAKGLWGRKIWAFARHDPHDAELGKHAIHLFGGLKIGLNLPVAWKNADVWDVGRGPGFRPGSWGGHDVPLLGYNAQGPICITWGRSQQMSWAGFGQYADESFAMIAPDWLAPDAKTPDGFDLPALHADLNEVTG